MRKGYCTIRKKLLSFLARSLLYNNLLWEAIFIISMVMIMGRGGEGWGMVLNEGVGGLETTQRKNYIYNNSHSSSK